MILRHLIDLFFPRLCPVCRHLLREDETGICSACLQGLPRTEQARLSGNNTEELFYRQPHFRRGAAWLFFRKGAEVQHLIHALKYREQPELGRCLGRIAALELMDTGYWDDVDVLMPVPLHPRRLRERGYNQSYYIALGIQEVTGIPIDTDHLHRIHYNAPQATTGGTLRADNVRGIFLVNHPEELFRRHIMLIDDVITTGSTLHACMDALLPVRGSHCSVFALARAR